MISDVVKSYNSDRSDLLTAIAECNDEKKMRIVERMSATVQTCYQLGYKPIFDRLTVRDAPRMLGLMWEPERNVE